MTNVNNVFFTKYIFRAFYVILKHFFLKIKIDITDNPKNNIYKKKKKENEKINFNK